MYRNGRWVILFLFSDTGSSSWCIFLRPFYAEVYFSLEDLCRNGENEKRKSGKMHTVQKVWTNINYRLVYQSTWIVILQITYWISHKYR